MASVGDATDHGRARKDASNLEQGRMVGALLLAGFPGPAPLPKAWMDEPCAGACHRGEGFPHLVRPQAKLPGLQHHRALPSLPKPATAPRALSRLAERELKVPQPTVPTKCAHYVFNENTGGKNTFRGLGGRGGGGTPEGRIGELSGGA